MLQRWLLPAPRVRTWFNALPGDAVLLRGVQSQVVARFHTSWSTGDGKRTILLLLGDGDAFYLDSAKANPKPMKQGVWPCTAARVACARNDSVP